MRIHIEGEAMYGHAGQERNRKCQEEKHKRWRRNIGRMELAGHSDSSNERRWWQVLCEP